MKIDIPFRHARLAVQAAFFAGFVYLFLSVPYPVAMPYSTLPLSVDPLAALGGAVFSRGAWLPALLPVGAFLLAAVLLGRAFCGWACPVGFLNDLVGLVRRGRDRNRYGYLQFGVPAAVLILSAFAVDVLALADPLVIFQRSLYVLWTGTAVPVVLLLIVLAALAVPRFWCRALCPLGGMLGVAGLLSPFGFRASDQCIRCGKCRRACPMGAIAKDLRWDATACTKCLECEKACSKGAVSFAPAAPQAPRISPSRRAFIAGAAALAALFASARAASALTGEKALIRPPGSLVEERFNAACARCESCVRACPNQVIRPAGPDAGLERFYTPSLDFDKGYCMRCGTCGQVCPTGAVISLPEEQIKLGTASIDTTLCLAWNGVRCLVCDEVCPKRAIRGGSGRMRPRVDGDACIGCGQCQLNCPVEGKAIRVSGAGERRRS
ncbi:MAG: Polyferredoxin protein MvhB [Methanocella sp. PtaU1.Bin125]|nr:MAG: Polyferredoxin protein MvhB [Methanocella sp. PtaU1.Bin125]